jgi:hypothetical protein
MNRSLLLFVSLALLAGSAVPAVAQKPAVRPRRAALLRDIQQVFLNQVTREMALSPEQLPRFSRIVGAWAEKRGALEIGERSLRQALQDQLRPGVAANPDSVSRVVDAINANRVAYAETFRDEMRELVPVLTPVQRGQFQVARDRILQRIRDLQQQRAGGAGRGAINPQP